MKREEVLNSLRNMYDQSYSTKNELEIFNLLNELAVKFDLIEEFNNYVFSQEF